VYVNNNKLKVVVKVPYVPCDIHPDSVDDVLKPFIVPTIAIKQPESINIGDFMSQWIFIQPLVNIPKNYKDRDDCLNILIKLIGVFTFEDLTADYDLHYGNCGWLGDKPVFFDF
jgi:hypothetical protein